jgi:hypothetical protein
MVFLQNLLYGCDQAVHLLVSADGNTQEIVDPGLFKVPDQHASLPKSQKKLFAGNTGMGCKDEVRLGRQDCKPKLL